MERAKDEKSHQREPHHISENSKCGLIFPGWRHVTLTVCVIFFPEWRDLGTPARRYPNNINIRVKQGCVYRIYSDSVVFESYPWRQLELRNLLEFCLAVAAEQRIQHQFLSLTAKVWAMQPFSGCIKTYMLRMGSSARRLLFLAVTRGGARASQA